jgi:hypothetical protein
VDRNQPARLGERASSEAVKSYVRQIQFLPRSYRIDLRYLHQIASGERKLGCRGPMPVRPQQSDDIVGRQNLNSVPPRFELNNDAHKLHHIRVSSAAFARNIHPMGKRMDVEIGATGIGGAVEGWNVSRSAVYGIPRCWIGIRHLDSNSSDRWCGSIETTEMSVATHFAFNFREQRKHRCTIAKHHRSNVCVP